MAYKTLLLAYGFTGEAALRSLINFKEFDVNAIVTPPFKVSRYRPQLEELSVERLAKESGIPFIRTNEEKEIADLIKQYSPESLLISSYNKILSQGFLENMPKSYNIHHGNLPREKGNSGSEWAVILGKNEISITLHQVVPNLDSGSIFWQESVKISDKEDIRDLRKKIKGLIEKKLGLVYASILDPERYKLKEVFRREQTGEETYNCSIREEDGLIDWRLSSYKIHNLIRGLCDPELSPAFTFYKGQRIGIISAEVPKKSKKYEGRIPGKPISITPQGVEVLTCDSSILIKELIIERKIVPASTVIRSTKETLGNPLRTIQDLEEKIRILEGLIKND